MFLSELIETLQDIFETAGNVYCGVLGALPEADFQFDGLQIKYLELPDPANGVESVLAFMPSESCEPEVEEDLNEDGLGAARLVRGSHLDY